MALFVFQGETGILQRKRGRERVCQQPVWSLERSVQDAVLRVLRARVCVFGCVACVEAKRAPFVSGTCKPLLRQFLVETQGLTNKTDVDEVASLTFLVPHMHQPHFLSIICET